MVTIVAWPCHWRSQSSVPPPRWSRPLLPVWVCLRVWRKGSLCRDMFHNGKSHPTGTCRIQILAVPSSPFARVLPLISVFFVKKVLLSLFAPATVAVSAGSRFSLAVFLLLGQVQTFFLHKFTLVDFLFLFVSLEPDSQSSFLLHLFLVDFFLRLLFEENFSIFWQGVLMEVELYQNDLELLVVSFYRYFSLSRMERYLWSEKSWKLYQEGERIDF